jgi:hypothetical protein
MCSLKKKSHRLLKSIKVNRESLMGTIWGRLKHVPRHLVCAFTVGLSVQSHRHGINFLPRLTLGKIMDDAYRAHYSFPSTGKSKFFSTSFSQV